MVAIKKLYENEIRFDTFLCIYDSACRFKKLTTPHIHPKQVLEIMPKRASRKSRDGRIFFNYYFQYMLFIFYLKQGRLV